MNEYIVNFKGAICTIPLFAYVYADNEDDARHQAIAQGIKPHSIRSIKYYGKRKDYGHL